MLPDWSQSVIWALISGSESICASTCAGPKTELWLGNRKTVVLPRTPGSFWAATHAIMFGRLLGIIGWRSRNSALSAPGIRIIT